MIRRILSVLVLLVQMLLPMDKALAAEDTVDISSYIFAPFQLGTRDPVLPVWKLLDGGGAFIGYVFQTVDLAPIPGFSGTPVNLLIVMDKTGTFMDVRVISQNEPVFVDGLGPEPLYEFVHQYVGKSIGANIKVGSSTNGENRKTSANTYVDGVSKATASTRIINETILASALKVARERLNGLAPKAAARAKQDVFQSMDWDELLAKGMVRHLRVSNGDVAKAFGDKLPAGDANDTFIDYWIADLSVPSIARTLMTEDSMARIGRHVENFEEPILVMANGAYSIFGEKFVRNSVPDLLSIHQGVYQVNIRDADIDPITLKPGIPMPEQAIVLRVDTRLGFDPAQAWNFALRVVRQQNQFDDPVVHDFGVEYKLPASFFQYPKVEAEHPAWMASWTGHAGEIGLLLVFLALLTGALVNMRRVVARPGLLFWGRWAVLAFTLGFIGWRCQGQLSIVNVLAIEKALVSNGDLSFFLYDPFTFLLWVFVAVTVVLWGRGTFCGWLCPFGALQEFTAYVAKILHIRQLRVSPKLNAHLIKVKYVVLASIMIVAVVHPNTTDQMVEVEPFKTAITLFFDRHWPFVLYAVLLLGFNLVVFKGFCRYLCPLGAFLSVLAWPRRFKWIARRAECGSPCQLCAVRCRYQAIDHAGMINYTECFQCLDCVAIHDDDQQCVPLVQKRKKEQRHVA